MPEYHFSNTSTGIPVGTLMNGRYGPVVMYGYDPDGLTACHWLPFFPWDND